ncbi:MAG: single-stranded DNA-binding protein [Muribaculaceae bacterium]|nr:single-stranded DNA-binding protein [Bacteroidales bacterium]MDE6084724.1 single-stranded DNA-binding protein [Muribaculaceae bacterium]
MSVNKVILLGYVGCDPEVRYPQPDFPVAFLRLATNERSNAPSVEMTEWHTIVFNGENATIAERYIRKGTRLYVEGKLRTREYIDKMKINRKSTEIVVESFEILGRSAT